MFIGRVQRYVAALPTLGSRADVSRQSVAAQIFRGLFVILLLLEVLNAIGILHFGLTYTWSGLVVTGAIVFLGIEVVERIISRRIGAHLHWSAWGLAFTSIFIDAFGDMTHLYTQVGFYDTVAHAIGGAVTALVFAQMIAGLARAYRQGLSARIQILLAYTVAISFGAYYEMEEYLEDALTGSGRSGGNADTALDICMDVLGATLVLVVLLMWLYRQERGRRASVARVLR
jgi:hypothetical protein